MNNATFFHDFYAHNVFFIKKCFYLCHNANYAPRYKLLGTDTSIAKDAPSYLQERASVTVLSII